MSQRTGGDPMAHSRATDYMPTNVTNNFEC